MRAAVASLVLLALAGAAISHNPDAGKNMIELVTSKGYPIEEHYVTVGAGCICASFRARCGL